MLPLHKSNMPMIALLLIPLLVAESAIAAARVEVPSTTVRYHDLDLNSPEGIARLYERIYSAAVDVCRTAEGHQPLNGALARESDACINHSVAHAVRTVHNGKLSAFHWERIRGWKLHWSSGR
jgi:UrcA family protein